MVQFIHFSLQETRSQGSKTLMVLSCVCLLLTLVICATVAAFITISMQNGQTMKHSAAAKETIQVRKEDDTVVGGY